MKAIELTAGLIQYIESHSETLHPMLDELIKETHKRSDGIMQISSDQGVFMHVLAKLIRASNALEIGCFTGYSAIAVALALPEGGRLVTLDINEDTGAVARSYFQRAGVDAKVELRIAPATQSLRELAEEGWRERFDMAFIDADKQNYLHYYEACLGLVRPGGAILVDNVLWAGRVAQDGGDETTLAIKAFNDKVASDERVIKVLLNISDGLYLLFKKA